MNNVQVVMFNSDRKEQSRADEMISKFVCEMDRAYSVQRQDASVHSKSGGEFHIDDWFPAGGEGEHSAFNVYYSSIATGIFHGRIKCILAFESCMLIQAAAIVNALKKQSTNTAYRTAITKAHILVSNSSPVKKVGIEGKGMTFHLYLLTETLPTVVLDRIATASEVL